MLVPSDRAADTRRCLLVSTYNADRRPWNGVLFAFLRVIAKLETATILAPEGRLHFVGTPPSPAELLSHIGHRLCGAAARAIGLPGTAITHPTEVRNEHDLCFFACQFPHEIREIDQVRGWRARSQKAAIFLVECWSGQIDRHRRDLRILDRFDHVFVMNATAIPQLQRHTSAPISELCTGVDCAISAPDPRHARPIDILCLGRRPPEVHRRILDFAQASGRLYVHDPWLAPRAGDWTELRRLNADLVKHSRYFLVWEPRIGNPRKARRIGSDTALSTRYFEGAAGGAVLLGSRPAGATFDTRFGWPDAVIELSDDPGEIIEALDRDAARTTAIRIRNSANCLRRHDWSHRWAEVLSTLGLARTERHERRLRALAAQADRLDGGVNAS